MLTTTSIIMVIFSVAILLTFARLVRGPSLSDRVVAMDLLMLLGVGLILVYAIIKDQAIFIDVALVVALVSFLGTVAFAYYLEQREQNQK